MSAAGQGARIHLSVRLPPGTPPPPADGRVRVSVEDVTRADAPARALAREAFAPRMLSDGVLGPFELAAELPPGPDYALRVHVDCSGDGQVVPGDLVSTVRHPVGAGEARLEVPVDRVAEPPPATTADEP